MRLYPEYIYIYLFTWVPMAVEIEYSFTKINMSRDAMLFLGTIFRCLLSISNNILKLKNYIDGCVMCVFT